MFLKLIIFIALSLNLYSEENIGFLMNQKYMCLSIGALEDSKIIPIMSKEDVLKYPIRFYVDDKRVLHTDGKVRNLFSYNEKNKLYFEENTAIRLTVEEGKRYMFMMPLQDEMKGTILIYHCSETDNWTLN
jgi:hypothetical protein